MSLLAWRVLEASGMIHIVSITREGERDLSPAGQSKATRWSFQDKRAATTAVDLNTHHTLKLARTGGSPKVYVWGITDHARSYSC